MSKPISVQQHVADTAGQELSSVFESIALDCARISARIRTAGLSDIYGAVNQVNVQGEEQQKLDVFADETLIEEFSKCDAILAAVSEENEHPVLFEHPGAKYLAVFDPLDGSSNIDVNVNVGTIVSIVRSDGDSIEDTLLPPGASQVAACYVLYGPSTVMVITAGKGVSAFTLSEDRVFLLSMPEMLIPRQGPYYSVNETQVASSPQPFRDFRTHLWEKKVNGKDYGSRYIGSLVADFHRTLLKGGIFMYPSTEKAPSGKLRMLYEAYPLALIAEQAGGAATDGGTRILDLKPEKIHGRTPLAIGSKVEVEHLQALVHGSKQELAAG